MARLIDADKPIDVGKIGGRSDKKEAASLFAPEHGGSILYAQLVDDGRLVLVRESIRHPPEHNPTFTAQIDYFELANGRRIPREERIATEHGKVSKREVSEGIIETCIVRVDHETGAEFVHGTVTVNGEEVYSDGGAVRWSDCPPYEGYLRKLALEEHNRNAVKLLSEEYNSASRDEKPKMMLRYFNRSYGDAYEWGAENPELFISPDVFKNIRHDPELKSVIWETLMLAEERSGIFGEGNKHEFYKSIVQHYQL